MSFNPRVIQDDDDDRFLNCDEVESLDNLEFVADQLRNDSAHLAVRFPASSDGSGVFAQPICADVAEAHDATLSAKSHVQRQMELCLNQVEAVLSNKSKRQKSQRFLLRGLIAGVSLAVVAVTIVYTLNELRTDSTTNVRPIVSNTSTVPNINVGATSTAAAIAQHNPGFALTSVNQTPTNQTQMPSLTPVSFEMPVQFLDASGPEMEGLLDLYESDSTEAVMIEF